MITSSIFLNLNAVAGPSVTLPLATVSRWIELIVIVISHCGYTQCVVVNCFCFYSFEANRLTSLDGIEALPMLRELHISDQGLESLAQLSALVSLFMNNSHL